MSDTIVKPLPYRVDLAQNVKKTYLDTIFATQDNEAHRFDISLFRGNAQLQMPSGAAVSAYFIRYSDNATIPLSGSVDGSVVSVTLKKACYNKPGQFAVIIKVTTGSIISTVFYGEGTILVSSTSTYIDPEDVIPSLEDLLAQIATIEAATKAANTAAGNANTAAGNANTAAAKINGMTVSASSGTAAGATISEVNGVKHIAFKLPKGDKGDKGDPGTMENVTISSIGGLEDALGSLSEHKADKAGWTANKFIGTDENGNMTVKDAPSGNSGQPRNWMVNSNFVNPVNQRGATSGNVPGAYIIDRWTYDRLGAEATYSVQKGVGISVGAQSYIKQKLYYAQSEMEGKPFTVAIYLSDGTVWVKNTIFTVQDNDENTPWSNEGLRHTFDGECWTLTIAKLPACTIKHVALYEGTYTNANVPPYVPKDEAVELAECLRDYRKGRFFAQNTHTFAGLFMSNHDYGIPMRKTPVITAGLVYSFSQGAPTGLSASFVNDYNTEKGIYLVVLSNGVIDEDFAVVEYEASVD